MKRHDSVHHRALPIAAVGVLLVALVATRVAHLSTGPLDWDEGVYWLSMRSMRAGNTLFASVFSSQPPAFLLLTEPPWSWLGGSIEAARSVILAWAVIAVAAGYVLGWRLGGPIVGVATALVLTVDPRMVDQSITLQADGPATSLGLVSLAAAAVAVTVTGRRWQAVAAVLAGAAMAIGILTKLFDVGLVPALAFVLLSGGRRWTMIGLAAVGGLLATALVLLPIANAWPAMWAQAISLHVSTRSLYRGITVHYLLAFLDTDRPIVAAAALGLAVGWWRARRAWMVGVAWTAGAMGALVATRPVFAHHMVLVIPGLALLCGSGVVAVATFVGNRLDSRLRVGTAAVAGGAVVVAAALLMQLSLADLVVPTDTALAARLHALVPASALVLGDDQFDQALAARDAPPMFVDTSGVRLNGAGITASTLEAALSHDPRVCGVLFAAGRLSGLPGFVGWATGEYPMRTRLPAGAVLYTHAVCQG